MFEAILEMQFLKITLLLTSGSLCKFEIITKKFNDLDLFLTKLNKLFRLKSLVDFVILCVLGDKYSNETTFKSLNYFRISAKTLLFHC